jgi:hypothetical protein
VAAAVLSAGAGADNFSSTVPVSVAYRSDCTFTFSVQGSIVADSAGAATTTLPPGPYQLSITTPLPDNMWSSSICTEADFSLSGPGVSYSSYLGTGTGPNGATFDITLQPASTYTMVDQTHPTEPIVITTTATGSSSSLLPATMTSAPLPITATSQSDLIGSHTRATTPPFRGMLHAAVTAAGRVTLAFGGSAVTTLKAGRYTVVLSDRFTKGGVALRASGGTSQTLAAGAFAGSRGVRVTLTAGQWSVEASGAHPAAFAVTG